MNDKTVPAAHQAIRLAKHNEMSPADLLSHLVNGKVSIPMKDMPTIEGQKIKDWSPPVLTHPDGSRWLMAFTTPELASDFCSPDGMPYYISVDTRWVLHTLPAGIGMIFNLKSDDEYFQWSADGIASYKRDVLGW